MEGKLKLGELLMQAGAIDQLQLGAALGDQRKFGRPLGLTLVGMGFIDEETLIRTLARQLKLPIAWLRGKQIEREVIELVPSELALKHHCLPLLVTEDAGRKVLHLAMQDPRDLDALDTVGFHVGHTIKPVLAAPTELAESLRLHYEPGDQGVSSRGLDLDVGDQPVVEDVPELLVFERKADATAPALELETVVGAEAAGTAPTPIPTVLGTITRLLDLLMEEGVVDREDLLTQIDVLLNRKAAGSS
jgi:type IV pilus assembly protein PilB